MPLLDAVLKESLRLSPPVPYLGRSVQKDMMIGKHRIPAGAQVMVCPIVLHYHMDTFANGWDFIPERFMDGFGFDGKPLPSASKALGTTRQRRARGDSNAATRPEPYAFLAFSAGSRGCVGRRFAELEEKVLVAGAARPWVACAPCCSHGRMCCGSCRTGGARYAATQVHLGGGGGSRCIHRDRHHHATQGRQIEDQAHSANPHRRPALALLQVRRSHLACRAEQKHV